MKRKKVVPAHPPSHSTRNFTHSNNSRSHPPSSYTLNSRNNQSPSFHTFSKNLTHIKNSSKNMLPSFLKGKDKRVYPEDYKLYDISQYIDKNSDLITKYKFPNTQKYAARFKNGVQPCSDYKLELVEKIRGYKINISYGYRYIEKTHLQVKRQSTVNSQRSKRRYLAQFNMKHNPSGPKKSARVDGLNCYFNAKHFCASSIVQTKKIPAMMTPENCTRWFFKNGAKFHRNGQK